jgi:DNA-binding NtrC family response regulator
VKGDGAKVHGDAGGVKGDGAKVEGDDAIVNVGGAMLKDDGAIVSGDGAKLKGDAAKLKGDDAKLKGDDAKLKGDAAKLKGDDAKLKGDDAIVGGDAAKLKGDDAKLKGDDAIVGGDAAKLKGDDAIVGGDAAKLKGDDAKLKGDDAKVKGDDASVEGDGDEVEGDGAKVKGDGAEVEGDGAIVGGDDDGMASDGAIMGGDVAGVLGDDTIVRADVAIMGSDGATVEGDVDGVLGNATSRLRPGVPLDAPPAKVLLEVCFQAQRAFHILHTTLRGVSTEAGRLRARVWNARFPGGDLMAYARGGHARQAGVHTLILGDTGTGKELVARALAYARHLPYSEAEKRFTGRAAEGFHVVNTSGLALNLVDSLLFGHKKGAFTGADRDAPGVLAKCGPGEVLFLDEFGDLAPEVQVKLLRVVEQQKYTPVGTTEERTLGGTLVFAAQPTHFRSGGFRSDLRHRLHKHVIRLPTLRARIDSDPAELSFLVRLFATEVAGPAGAEGLAAGVLRLAEGRLRRYPWTGNVRELRACVTNMHEQREYEPPSGYAPPVSLPGRMPSVAPPAPPVAPVPPAPPSPAAELARAVVEGTMSVAEMRDRYIVHVFERMGRSYKEAARVLEIDWRTVRAAVEVERVRGREAA